MSTRTTPNGSGNRTPCCWNFFFGRRQKFLRSATTTVVPSKPIRSFAPIVDLQANLTVAFEKLELSFADLDRDNIGSIDIDDMLFVLRCRGFRQEARLKAGFKEYVDSDLEQKIGFYEFLGLALFWHTRGQTLGALTYSLEAARLIAESFDEVLQGFVVVAGGDKGAPHLSHKQVERYFARWLPNQPSPAALVMGCGSTLSIRDLIKVLYQSLRGDQFLQNHSPQDFSKLNKQLLAESLRVLETDFRRAAQDDGHITLQDLLKGSEHALVAGKVEAPVPPRCVGCDAPTCEYRCPFIACRFDVCTECWNEGLRAHVVQPGGNGPKVQRDAIILQTRAIFAMTNADDSGALTFFEYILMAYVFTKSFHYRDLCPTSDASNLVRQSLTWVAKQMREFNPSGNATGPASTLTLNRPQFTQFAEQKLEVAPQDAAAAFDKFRTDGVVPVMGVFQFMYALLRPEGKQGALSIMPKKPRRPTNPVLPSVSSPLASEQVTFSNVEPRRVKKLKRLGGGGQCHAWLATYQGVTLVAKVPRPNSDGHARRAMLEAGRLQQHVKHPFVTHVFGMCRAPQREVLLTEFCPNGSVDALYHHAAPGGENPISRELQWRIAHQLADALGAMHGVNIMHRDLKGANVLLTKNCDVKLADFDLATSEPSSTDTCGTPGFMAPEVMMAEDTHEPYDKSCDVFSYGGVLYELTHNHTPFVTANLGSYDGFKAFWAALKEVVCSVKRPALTRSRVTPEMGRLIHACWHRDPTQRPAMSEVSKVLDAVKSDYVLAPRR